MKKQVLILEFHQETNDFNPIVAESSAFNNGGELEGEDVLQNRLQIPCAVHGACDAIRETGAQFVPTVFMSAESGGRVSDKVLRYVMERVEEYANNNDFDAIYASLHGATCTESDDDACGTLLAHLRALAGDKPIAASFDLHANITEKILRNADIICGYQTYPHNDFYETGYRAGKLCMELLSGKKRPVASAAVPMLVPPAGYNSNEGAFGQLLSWGKELMAKGAIIDFTVFPVQPWLNIPEIASRVVVIAQDANTAKEYANLLAMQLADMGDKMQPDLRSVDEIIDIAQKNTTAKPVVLSEFADSPNGGCVGDSPVVAMCLLERGSTLRAAVPVVDPEAVKTAFCLGVGGKGIFSVGAGFTPGMPGPLVAEGEVLSLHNGHFILEGPAGRGKSSSIGNCAVVRFGSIDILIHSWGGHSGDPQLLRHFGIEPTLYDLVVVKANTSFRLPYSKMTDLIYYADTPGAGASDLSKLPFTRLPEGMYPFARDIAAEKAKEY